MKIKINQTVVSTEQVEKEISIPCFRKESETGNPTYVAIRGENNYTRVFFMENADGEIHYASMTSDEQGTVASYFKDNKYEEITAEQYMEVEKRVLEYYARQAKDNYMVKIEPLPTVEA